MIQSLFIMSNAGEVLIEKHWREVTPRSVCDYFWDEVCKLEDREEIPPIMAVNKGFIISVYRYDMFLIAKVQQETPPLLCIEFLHRVLDILADYLGAVDETSIKESFSLVYQLLEEMMDNGHPMTTEPNALKAMIKPPTVMGRVVAAATGRSDAISEALPDGTISAMPWRKAGVRYAQNEIYLDIIEEVDAIVAANGQVVSSEVTGSIQAVSHLSGIPDLLLTFQDPSLIDDCSFHPCVRYGRFERDRVVSFVPPDGAFELMRYRVATGAHHILPRGNIIPPLYCNATVSFSDGAGGGGGGGSGGSGSGGGSGGGRVHVGLGTRAPNSLRFPGRKTASMLEDVEVTVPFPRAVRTANLSATAGTVLFDEAAKVARWSVGKLAMGSVGQRPPQMAGALVLQPGARLEESPSIHVAWKVPVASISGLSIASLQLTNERYKPYKGVRTLTKSGKFTVRTS
ncbi:Mu homology domain-containing protein [Tribonema minus]|uniref:Mu homology domain-containing protein n=1 Tax=Tribonema minus TaxID=303371 RepID=A0A835YUG2_9STRA|nr:Mu homology domain-containing protein [Tribonema minus]